MRNRSWTKIHLINCSLLKGMLDTKDVYGENMIGLLLLRGTCGKAVNCLWNVISFLLEDSERDDLPPNRVDNSPSHVLPHLQPHHYLSLTCLHLYCLLSPRGH